MPNNCQMYMRNLTHCPHEVDQVLLPIDAAEIKNKRSALAQAADLRPNRRLSRGPRWQGYTVRNCHNGREGEAKLLQLSRLDLSRHMDSRRALQIGSLDQPDPHVFRKATP